MRTIVHLSDIHFGRVDQATVTPLMNAINEVKPTVVVVSGDLTQRARESQFREAKAFLDTLPHPQIVVPGNHDVPLYNVVARFVSPLSNYRKIISENTEPVYRDEEIVVVGINTARSLTWKNGRINEDQVARVTAIFRDLPESVTKVVVTHHPFDLPRRYTEEALLGRADMAMEQLAGCGADIFLSGHYHIGHTGDTRTRYHIPGFNGIIVHAGTAISTRGRGEANSFNVIVVDHPKINVDRFEWHPEKGVFERFVSERFAYGAGGWERVADVHAPKEIPGV
jgi:3',5'-cyclic AMP phosphodiesterase CpdA